VSLTFSTSSEIQVHVQQSVATKSWSFTNAYAGVLGLAERVKQLQATTPDISIKKIATGEYRSDKGVAEFSYRVQLPDLRGQDLTHSTWLTDSYGYLMLADLLPQSSEGVLTDLELSMPADWEAYSTNRSLGNNRFSLSEPENAIFFVGKGLKGERKTIAGMELGIVSAGQWSFANEKVMDVAAKVFKEYLEITGFRLSKALVMIAPAPYPTASNWRAETRDGSIVLVLNPTANVKNWLGQLGVIFTHEMLHFWVPNSLSLKGSYDWFFEGFTLYQALCTALKLKLINFREYLDTLARVYDSYLSYQDSWSLMEASERRWTNTFPTVYDKGMLVAFLYDLSVRSESGGSTTLAARYRQLFALRGTEGADANEVIIKLLNTSTRASALTREYVESTTPLQLEQLLSPYGLSLDATGKTSRLTVMKDLTGNQKKLLRSLGYRD